MLAESRSAPASTNTDAPEASCMVNGCSAYLFATVTSLVARARCTSTGPARLPGLQALHHTERVHRGQLGAEPPEHRPRRLPGRPAGRGVLDQRLVDHRDADAVADDVLVERAEDRLQRPDPPRP